MRRYAISLLVGLLLAGPLPASADLCFSNGFATWVGKGFRFPAKGKCRAWNGFLTTTVFKESFGSGTACRSSTQDVIRLSLHFSRIDAIWGNIAYITHITFPLPPATDGTSTEIVMRPGQPTSESTTPVSVVPCVPKNVPVP